MSGEEKDIVWAPILAEEINKYIEEKRSSVNKGEKGYYFERSELEAYLVNKYPEATHGSIVGVLNKFLVSDNDIERVKRGHYVAINRDSLVTGKKVLLDCISKLEEVILGNNIDVKIGFTQSDLEFITGINLALRELKNAVVEIKKIEQSE